MPHFLITLPGGERHIEAASPLEAALIHYGPATTQDGLRTSATNDPDITIVHLSQAYGAARVTTERLIVRRIAQAPTPTPHPLTEVAPQRRHPTHGGAPTERGAPLAFRAEPPSSGTHLLTDLHGVPWKRAETPSAPVAVPVPTLETRTRVDEPLDAEESQSGRQLAELMPG